MAVFSLEQYNYGIYKTHIQKSCLCCNEIWTQMDHGILRYKVKMGIFMKEV